MKLLVITREFPPYVLGGLSYHLSYLYEKITNYGHDVTVIAGQRGRNIAEGGETELVPDGVTVQRVTYPNHGKPHLAFLPALRLFLRDFNTTQFDAILTHTPVPFQFDVPMIAKFHECMREERKYFKPELPLHSQIIDTLVSPVNKRIDQRALNKASKVIFNSNLCKSGWKRHYDLHSESTVVYNGVDKNIFYPRATPDNEYALFVGSATERKGISRVIEFAKSSDIAVRVVGSSIQHPAVETVGRISPEELATQYSGAIATIHPAKFEAFGNVLLESLACGTPVVATNQCGAVEIMNEDSAVVTADLSNGIEIAREKSADACTTVADQYTWSNVAKETIDVVNTVA